MKNAEIVQALNGIVSVINNQATLIKRDPLSKRLPVKVSFAIHKNKQTLTDVYKPYLDTLNALDKNSATYQEEIRELLDTDVDVELKCVSEDDFKDYDPALSELEALSFMLEE